MPSHLHVVPDLPNANNSGGASFTADKTDLSHAATWVARNLPARPTQPILASMVFTAGKTLALSGYDYDVSTYIDVSADVHTEGKFGVSGKLVADVLSKLPNKPVTFHEQDTTVLVTCGTSRFEIPKVTLEDYPAMPELPVASGSIDPTTFITAVKQVTVAATKDKDTAVPMLAGTYIEVEGDQLRLVSTDRFRLAMRTIPWEPVTYGAGGSILVPASTLADLANFVDPASATPVTMNFGDTSNPDDITTSTTLLGVATEPRETTIRLIDATFPSYKRLFPTSFTTAIQIPSGVLIDALKRVTLMSSHDTPKVTFTINTDNTLTLQCTADEGLGEAEETLPCKVAGAPMSVSFQTPYIIDGLKAVTTPEAVMCFTDALRPAIIRPATDPTPVHINEDGSISCDEGNFTYLLMPIR